MAVPDKPHEGQERGQQRQQCCTLYKDFHGAKYLFQEILGYLLSAYEGGGEALQCQWRGTGLLVLIQYSEFIDYYNVEP